MTDFVVCLDALWVQRRRATLDDLISMLLQAEEAGEELWSRRSLYSMVLLLSLVGHETSVYLIGNCVLGLLLHAPVAASPAGARLVPPSKVDPI